MFVIGHARRCLVLARGGFLSPCLHVTGETHHSQTPSLCAPFLLSRVSAPPSPSPRSEEVITSPADIDRSPRPFVAIDDLLLKTDTRVTRQPGSYAATHTGTRAGRQTGRQKGVAGASGRTVDDTRYSTSSIPASLPVNLSFDLWMSSQTSASSLASHDTTTPWKISPAGQGSSPLGLPR